MRTRYRTPFPGTEALTQYASNPFLRSSATDALASGSDEELATWIVNPRSCARAIKVEKLIVNRQEVIFSGIRLFIIFAINISLFQCCICLCGAKRREHWGAERRPRRGSYHRKFILSCNLFQFRTS